MKRFIFALVLILCFLISTTTSVFANNVIIVQKRWKNPQQIYTYVPSGSRNSELMKEAFAYWMKVTNGKVRFIYVNEAQKAQLRVRFVKDASVSSNIDNALGVTYYKKVKMICSERSCTQYMVLTT